MLKQRVLTAVVLVAVLLGVMLGLPPIATVWLITVLMLIGAWEWAAFIGNGSPAARAAFTVAGGGVADRLPLLLCASLRSSCSARDDRRDGVVDGRVPVGLPRARRACIPLAPASPGCWRWCRAGWRWST